MLFKMLPHENANKMFSRLNVLVVQLNDLGISKMNEIEIIRKILGALPKEKYADIVTYFHQKNLEKYKISLILGRLVVMRCIWVSIMMKVLPPPRRMTLHSRQPKKRM